MRKTNSEAPVFSEEEYPAQRLTGEIIGAFYYVYHKFGFGFLESVYKRALAIELEHRGIVVDFEVPFELFHRGVAVGTYRADMIGDKRVIVEAKSGLTLDPAVSLQLLNYLSAARLRVGLVLHFGPRPSVKRLIASSHRLENLTPQLDGISDRERRTQ